MSKIILFCLIFTSFLPLWVSIIFIDIISLLENSDDIMTEIISVVIIFLISFFSFIMLYNFLSKKSKEGSIIVTLNSIVEEKNVTSEYLLSYILPLLAFDFTKWDKIILFLIFFITLVFLYIRHNYFSVNILLELVGYKIFKCQVENTDKVLIDTYILSRRNLMISKGERIYIKSLNNQLKLDFGEN
ncbi:hypothetical protein [Gemella morbillorum]|uniref:hypothetical protein n=1 Tax=Gemella morbillorum TaxID=29391 RepID=UPI0028D28713|nr:hypothetical protein [Gemella morbillorum]